MNNLNSKIFDINSELSEFRKTTTEDKKTTYNQILYATKKRIAHYRGIFLLFAFLFALLAFLIFIKTSIFLVLSIKPVISLIALGLSLSSLYMFFSISLEKESIKCVYRLTILKLNNLYSQEKTRYSPDDFLSFIKHRLTVRRLYSHVKEKLKHKEIETLHLLDRIKHTDSLPLHEKEELFNQALLELNNDFHEIVTNYEFHKSL